MNDHLALHELALFAARMFESLFAILPQSPGLSINGLGDYVFCSPKSRTPADMEPLKAWSDTYRKKMKCHSGDIFEPQMEITTQLHPPLLPQPASLISEVNVAPFPLSGGWAGRRERERNDIPFCL